MTLFIDESEAGKRKVIGGVLVPESSLYVLEDKCMHHRFNTNLFGEIKWEKAKNPYHEKYKLFVDEFFKDSYLTFHCYTYVEREDRYPVAYGMIRSVCYKLSDYGDDSSLNILFDQGDEKEVNLIQDYLEKDDYISHAINVCTTGKSAVFSSLQISDILVGYVASTINDSVEKMDDGKRELRKYIHERNGGDVVHLRRFPRLYEFKMHRFDPQKYVYDKNRE